MSDREVDDFSLEARLRDLEAVIDALALETFSLYAVSAGGPVGIAYAARHPERVTRLALASTQASFAWMDDKTRDRFVRLISVFETDWDVPTVSHMMVDLLAPEADDVTRRVLGEFLRRSGDGAAIAGFLRAHLEIDVEDEARQVSTSTLVFHARDDAAIRLEAGRRLASLIPNARFEIVDGGHLEGVGSTPAERAQIMAFLTE
jgi:pimeloyl-ACP methyl ester carboxylesterase